MGNESSSEKQQLGLLNTVSLPPPPTVRLTEKDHFEELHQKLLQIASLHPGNETPFSLRQISEIISSFLPPTTAFATGGEIIFQFPAANELRITAIEIGEITTSQLTPQVIQVGHDEKKQFHVKLIFDGTKFNLGFPPIPNTNSFHYKPNSMEFDIISETKGDNQTLSKSQNEVLADLVVMKSTVSPPQAVTCTTTLASSLSGEGAASAPKEEVVQVIPMRDDSFVKETRYSETIPASYFLQYIGTRLCSVDFSNVHHMLEIPQVPITVTACLVALKSTSNHGWVLHSVERLELHEQLMILMDDIKYLVDGIRCLFSSCAFYATVVEPEVQLLSLQLYHLQGKTTSANLTISKPMDRLQYARRHTPMLPIIPQDLKVSPPKSLGAITFSNQGQLSVVSMKLPRFFQQYCFVQLITNFTVKPGDMLTMHGGYLQTSINCNKIEFLEGQFRKLSAAPISHISLGLKLALTQGQEKQDFLFFYIENLTEHSLIQESLSGITKPVGNVNLGQMLLDQCNFFIWKNRNHQVTAKKLNELREYTIISISSNVSFTKCIFEITMEICKNSQPTITTTMTMLLDLEKMIATIFEKQLLNIELEFGLQSADALSCLQSHLYNTTANSSQFHDISLCFESTTSTIP